MFFLVICNELGRQKRDLTKVQGNIREKREVETEDQILRRSYGSNLRQETVA